MKSFLRMNGSLQVFLLLTWVWLGISANAQEDRPNILWISCEDMSPWLGAYGDSFASTPNIDQLASESIRYNNAWSTMPICAPARSTLITGVYATAMGSMNLRSEVPRSEQVKPLPLLLREQGYHCTNNVKTDYNFSPAGLWDAMGPEVHWRDRPHPDQPFFHVLNYTSTHEGNTQQYGESVSGIVHPHDPTKVPVPVHLPDTPEMRAILAHHYDLISGLDAFVGKVLAELESDGLRENTIVFFFSDHGSGLPRYKRWLYQTGLRVPLLVHVPERFRSLREGVSPVTEQLVGFVDFAPTVLSLVGAEPPAFQQGNAFLGQPVDGPQPYLFGARDRADDLEDLSRCVRDGRYLYIRNFQPFRPYVRYAAIFSAAKSSYGVIHREMQRDEPHPEVVRMFHPKAHEELYDLKTDPDELHNLAQDPAFAAVKQRLGAALNDWLLDIRDAAFLPEGEMMRRGAHDSVYDMAQDPLRYDLETILKAAHLSSDPSTSLTELQTLANHPEVGVRYWAACGFLGRALELDAKGVELLEPLLSDSHPSVVTVAAEALLKIQPDHEQAMQQLLAITGRYLLTEPTFALRSARALAESGEAVKPWLPQIQALSQQVEGPVWGLYRNWSYPMFIGMSLHLAQMNADVVIDRYQQD